MLQGLAKGAGVAAVGLALILGQGCKKKQAPAAVKPVVRTVPRAAQPDFPDDPPPVPVIADKGTHHSVHRVIVPAVAPARPPAVDPEALAEAQRQRDASLLQKQQAASQRQQQELNRIVEQSQKLQQQQDEEPRIQEVPGTAPAPGIQDAPGPGPAPRIQDAPGPSDTLPPSPPPQL